MKIKDEYILQNIADKWVVISINAKSVNFNKILSLNSSGRFLWEHLEAGAECDDLVSRLIDHFEIDEALARKDVEKFVRELKDLDCIDE